MIKSLKKDAKQAKVVYIASDPDREGEAIAWHLKDALGIKDNKYNGYITPMWDSESKKKAIKELCEKYDIDLSKSYAYGDTAGDFTMFKSVGIPYAMNPTRELITKITDDEDLKKKIADSIDNNEIAIPLLEDIEDSFGSAEKLQEKDNEIAKLNAYDSI